jgi:hypothetical protein
MVTNCQETKQDCQISTIPLLRKGLPDTKGISITDDDTLFVSMFSASGTNEPAT